MRNKKVKSF